MGHNVLLYIMDVGIKQRYTVGKICDSTMCYMMYLNALRPPHLHEASW